MSYSQVKTPKFYINIAALALAQGKISENENNKYLLNPQNITSLQNLTIKFTNSLYLTDLSDIWILGHAFNTQSIRPVFNFFNDLNESVSFIYNLENSLQDSNVNIKPNQTLPFDNDGWSKIATNVWYTGYGGTISNSNINTCSCRFVTATGNVSTSADIGDVVLTTSYTMPQNPDLNLTQTIQNETIKSVTTLGGKTFSYSGYNNQPKWILNPWEIGNLTTYAEGFNIPVSGRKVWKLNFSMIDSNDIFPYNNNGQLYKQTQGFYKLKNDFISKVWHGTCQGKNSFIFQPDDTLDEYAICRFDQNSLDIQQQTPNTYNVTLTIKEVW